MIALDAMEKSAAISLLQAELNDFLGTVIKIQGDVSAVKVALEVAAKLVQEMGIQPHTTLLSNPSEDALQKGILSRQEFSPLLQQNVVLGQATKAPVATKPPAKKTGTSPTSSPTPSPQHPESRATMSDSHPLALGFIETQGFTAVFEAIDHACKAANVEVLAKEKLGGGYVTVVIQGDVAAVKAAIDAGKTKVEGLGKLIAAHVIARPSATVMSLLPKA